MKKRHKRYARMAKELRDLRLQNDLSRQQLADKIGCTLWNVRAAEDCLSVPKYKLMKQLAVFFGRPEDHFINLIDKTEDNPKQEPETVYPETVEQIHAPEANHVPIDSRVSFYWVWAFIKELALLEDDAAMRIFRQLEDTLANPANLRDYSYRGQ